MRRGMCYSVLTPLHPVGTHSSVTLSTLHPHTFPYSSAFNSCRSLDLSGCIVSLMLLRRNQAWSNCPGGTLVMSAICWLCILSRTLSAHVHIGSVCEKSLGSQIITAPAWPTQFREHPCRSVNYCYKHSLIGRACSARGGAGCRFNVTTCSFFSSFHVPIRKPPILRRLRLTHCMKSKIAR
jgi:hypothetical protein